MSLCISHLYLSPFVYSYTGTIAICKKLKCMGESVRMRAKYTFSITVIWFSNDVRSLASFFKFLFFSSLSQCVRCPCGNSGWNCEWGLEGISAPQEGKRALEKILPILPQIWRANQGSSQPVLQHNLPQLCHCHWSKAVELTPGPTPHLHSLKPL